VLILIWCIASRLITGTNVHSEISMPQDLHDLEQRAVEVGAVLLVLDPLMSRLSDRLDTHRDAEVRLALEPLAALANRAHLAVLGIIHHNKSGSTDPLQVIMGSRIHCGSSVGAYRDLGPGR
jgi:hypothetical protein